MVKRSERVLTVDEYLSQLPRPAEVPKVEQRELFHLFRKFTRDGVIDEELLAEVESRIYARAELVIDETDLFYKGLFAADVDPADVISKDEKGEPTAIRLRGSGKIVEPLKGSPDDDLSHEDVKVIKAFERYDIVYTDYGGRALKEALEEMKRSRIGGDPRRRLLAVDKMIHVVHGAGPMADTFIRGEKEGEPYDPADFLDVLAGNAPFYTTPIPREWYTHAGYRRPVRVRAHRRRA